jgi:predicted AAA+ superfamily ATPase
LQEVEELYNASARPNFETARIGVFTHTTNDVANGRKVEGGITLRTLWGELAYQLGGAAAYQIIRENDQQMIAPGGLFKQILSAHAPALILIDELADYCVKASAKEVGKSTLSEQTISFMQELTEAVSQTPGCVLVVTLPASSSEVGASEAAYQILSSLERRIARVAADTQPIQNEEIFAVIRKRLFEYAGSEELRQQVADYYFNFYSTYRQSLPERRRQPAYKQNLLQAYPFHPELIDIFRARWASHLDFQRTRGVLRLLAAILCRAYAEPLKSAFEEEALLHSGDFDLDELSALTAQMKRLYGNQYEAVL